MASPALDVPLLFHRFSNKPATNLPNDMLRNPSFCSFASFLIVLLIPFINKPDSSCYWTIFMISFISSFEIVNVVYFAKSERRIPDPKFFL